MLFYAIPACCVFAVFLSALCLNDPEPVEPIQLWTGILLTALLWPLTLPSMLARGCSVFWQVFNRSLAG